MAHLVLAYPVLSDEDYTLIQDYRRDHDKQYYSVVQPHFSIVFPEVKLTEKEFVDEIRQLSVGVEKIEFIIRCATINNDALSDDYNLFLVPDEGHSRIIRLHDKLYSGILSSKLRLDIDYIPHISIGISKDKSECKKWADEWNAKEFSIHGQISKLSIVSFVDNKVSLLEEIKLK